MKWIIYTLVLVNVAILLFVIISPQKAVDLMQRFSSCARGFFNSKIDKCMAWIKKKLGK